MSCKILTRGMLHLLVDVLVEGSALDFFRAKEVADASACHFRHGMTANQVNSHQGLNEAVKTNQAGWSTLSREEETLSSISTTKTMFSFIRIDLSGQRDLTPDVGGLAVNAVELSRYRHSGESRNPDSMRLSGPRLPPG